MRHRRQNSDSVSWQENAVVEEIYFTRNGYCQRVETKYSIRNQYYTDVILSLHFMTPTIAFRTKNSMLQIHILILLSNKKLSQYEFKMWTVVNIYCISISLQHVHTIVPNKLYKILFYKKLTYTIYYKCLICVKVNTNITLRSIQPNMKFGLVKF